MITKTLKEIIKEIDEKYYQEKGYYPTPTYLALDVAKEVRRLTLEEVNNVAEVMIVDEDHLGNKIWSTDSDSILKLDLNLIQIW